MLKKRNFLRNFCVIGASKTMKQYFAMKTVIYPFFLLLLLFTISGHILAQRVNVTGKVSDATTNQPIHRISVVEKNSGIGTMTSEDGSYSLFLQRGEVELEFSGMNYDTQKVIFILRNDTIVDTKTTMAFQERRRKVVKNNVVAVQHELTIKASNRSPIPLH